MSKLRISRRRIAPYVQAIEEAGGMVRGVGSTGSCHVRLTVSLGTTEHRLVIPSSPGDHRGILNFRGHVWRLAKALEGDKP